MTTALAGTRTTASYIYSVIDVAATFLIAVGGASIGARAGLDLLGIVVIGFTAALAGGVIRDVLLGDVPPAAFRSPVRILAALIGALLAFAAYTAVTYVPVWLVISADAAALSLFTVTGAEKAIVNKSNGLVAVMLGMITAVGGGVVRDVLLNHVPTVLTTSVYATAAAAGALALVIAARLRVPMAVAMLIGFLVCLVLRALAVLQGWELPSLD